MTESQRPLRIGILTDGLEERATADGVQIANGGVGVYIYNLIKHLRVVDPVNEYFLIRHGHGNLDIYHGGNGQRVVFFHSARLYEGRMFDLPCRRIATELQLDLLHYPNQFGGAFLPKRIKRVVTVHDITPVLFPHQHPWQRVVANRLMIRPSLRAANHVIAVSANTRADLLARRLVRDDQVSVISLAAPPGFRPGVHSEGFVRRYDLPARFILTVGVLEPRKNHTLLVQALSRLHAVGERVGVVIVGREGWRWQDPLADASLAHLRPWVRILREVPDADLAELYNRAEVFAYPSYYEGFGLPVVEAMACGTPVVTSAVSSLPEVAGQAALFVDPTNAEDLAAKLLAVLRDTALRQQLIAAGKLRTAELTWERTARATLEVYEHVCGIS